MPEQVEAAGEPLAAELAGVARTALATFGLAEDSTITLIHHRENAVFRIDDAMSGRRWALRVHRPGYRTTAQIRSELAWMAALREAGLRTPEPLRARDGADVWTVRRPGLDAHDVDVLGWIEGTPLERDASNDAYRLLGRTSALMHRHARSWTRPAGFDRPLLDLEGLVGRRAVWGWYGDLDVLAGEELALANRAAAAVAERLRAFGRGPDRFGLTHGDLMPDNVLLEDGVPHVIDFDDCGFGWHLYDLATLLAVNVGGDDYDRIRNAWIAGYREIERLPASHAYEIEALVMARMLLGLGWLHTRRETEFARSLTPVIVQLACLQAEKTLSLYGSSPEG
jgi:Ser/Thr protein kinase RdoA (MazF antagonist)